MKNEIPQFVAEAEVLYYSVINNMHNHTGGCIHEITGLSIEGKAEWGAICKYDGVEGYYLFFSYPTDSLTDTYHDTIEEAKEQAEFEYEGISQTWIKSK